MIIGLILCLASIFSYFNPPFRSSVTQLFKSSIYLQRIRQKEKTEKQIRNAIIVTYGFPGQKFTNRTLDDTKIDEFEKYSEADLSKHERFGF